MSHTDVLAHCTHGKPVPGQCNECVAYYNQQQVKREAAQLRELLPDETVNTP